MPEQELNLLSLAAAIVAQLRAGLLPMRGIRRLSVWRRSDLQQQAGPGQVSGNNCVARGGRTADQPSETGERRLRPQPGRRVLQERGDSQIATCQAATRTGAVDRPLH